MGRSLTAIRPQSVRFLHKAKPEKIIEQEALAYRTAAKQADMLDNDIEPFTPTPYVLAFSYVDQEGILHTNQCGDWETHAAFYRWRREYGEKKTLAKLKDTYENEYMSKGMALVLGTLAKRPRQWTLLGVIRLDHGPYQAGFKF